MNFFENFVIKKFFMVIILEYVGGMLPVVLNLKGKKVVVFGAGKVAERRIIKLMEAGADITVISKEFTEKINKLNVKKVNMEINDKNFKNLEKYIENSDFIIAATNNKYINDKIEEAARKHKKLVNRADKVSDFIFPAEIRYGDVVISISTSGRSPAIAKALKRRILNVLNKEDLDLLEIENFAREKLKELIKDQEKRREFLREILKSKEIVDSLREKGLSKTKEIIIKEIKKLEVGN